MTTSNLADPAKLPVFIDGARKDVDLWANGYEIHAQHWDGRTNKVEITPTVRVPGWIHSSILVGQSYTISERELRRRVISGRYTKQVEGGSK